MMSEKACIVLNIEFNKKYADQILFKTVRGLLRTRNNSLVKKNSDIIEQQTTIAVP